LPAVDEYGPKCEPRAARSRPKEQVEAGQASHDEAPDSRKRVSAGQASPRAAWNRRYAPATRAVCRAPRPRGPPAGHPSPRETVCARDGTTPILIAANPRRPGPGRCVECGARFTLSNSRAREPLKLLLNRPWTRSRAGRMFVYYKLLRRAACRADPRYRERVQPSRRRRAAPAGDAKLAELENSSSRPRRAGAGALEALRGAGRA